MAAPTSLRRQHARREMYGLLAELLSFPTGQLADAIASGKVAAAARGLAGALPYRLAAPEGLDAALEPSELEPEYIRLFDLPGASPCPLYTGIYSPVRRDAMEEILRFYRFFGLTVAHTGKDLPDAVPTVIEFMQFLVLREEAGETPHEVRIAQRDLLQRHLLPWASATHQRLPGRSPAPCYEAIVALAAHFFAADASYLDALAGHDSGAKNAKRAVRA